MPEPTARTLTDRGRVAYRAATSSPVLLPVIVHTVRRHQRQRLVSASSDVVIDGFPRSANTFAVHAFRFANPDAAIAHHLHCAGHLLRGVRLGVPAIAVIRDPAGAVISEAIRDRRRSLAGLLDDWHHLYAALEPALHRIVLAPFPTVTTAFGTIIAAANDRFGTDFAPYEPSAANDAAVIAAIDRVTQERWPSAIEQERRAARPSDDRAGARTSIEEELRRPELADRLAAARALHDRLLERQRDVT